MDIFNAGMASFFTKRLVRREAELRHDLHAANELMHQANEAGPRGFVDLKETAAEQSLATVDEAKVEHAVCELEDLLAARLRLADRSYGQCADCGEAIDLGRLMALAATPCCTTCQAIREHGADGAGHVPQRPRSYRGVGVYQLPACDHGHPLT